MIFNSPIYNLKRTKKRQMAIRRVLVIYARYSSASQTEQSIEGQLDVCKKYAQDNDLQIVDTYIDRAMTGKNDQRVAFQKLLSDSEKPVTWEIVLVYAIDRFGRNSIEIAVNKQRLKRTVKRSFPLRNAPRRI